MHKLKIFTFLGVFFSLTILVGVFACNSAKAESYYASGILKSNNVLSGADISDINNFHVTASIPASTSVAISFSQDKTVYYNASSTKGAWTDVASGTTIIDMSDLAWTGALLFYKLKLTTTDASSTPTVGEIRVNYDGTDVPTATSSRYGSWGIILSNNLLSGATVNSITNFYATTSLPSGSMARVTFSQDKSSFYSASGTKGAWTDLSDGDNNIDLTGLSWIGASFYYKIRLEAMIDPAVQPKLTEARVVYDGTDAPPLTGSDYNWTGVLVSSDFLASTTDPLTGYEWFGYAISYMPYGASVKAQFSSDGSNWYSSDGTAWSWDDLSFGDNITAGRAVSLSGLNWGGETNFYYKLKFSLVNDNSYSPVLKSIGLYSYSAYMLNGTKGSAPVAHWNFNEGYGSLCHDFSLNGKNGSLIASTSGSNTSAVDMWSQNGKMDGAVEFDGTDDWIDVGDINQASSTAFGFWIKANALTDSVMDFDNGTHTVTLNSGSIQANGFSSTTIYVDGFESSVIDTAWHHVVIVSSEQIDVNDFDIGRVGNDYFSGLLDEVKIWDYALTTDNIKIELNQGKAVIMGSVSTEADGKTPSYSKSRKYCVPGDTSVCDPPVLELKLDEKVGTTTFDKSGQGSDGVFVSLASSPKWWGAYKCKLGNCLEFDGANDYVSVGNAYDGVKTIAFWLKTNSANEKVLDLNGTANIEVVSGKLTANNFVNPSIYLDSVVSSTTDTNWHYVTITTGTGIDASAVDIGRISSDYFKGFIDHIYFYDYDRTPAQIAWDYNRGKASAYWQFNECQGNSVYDYSGNAHDGSLIVGGGGTQTATGTCTTLSAVSAWYNGLSGKFESSLSFDGTDDYADIGDTGVITKTISFWIKPDSATEDIIDFDGGTHTVTISSGNVSAFGFSSPSIYVNTTAGGSVTAGSWNHILITTNTGITASDMEIGRIGSGYFDGQIDEIRLYNYILTDAQIKIDYNGDKAMRFN
ncbi:MAG: hypothetical protein PF572_02225 [Patescibacteria group bacterium]|jgi:hypothetical protein|nr:hypothetical protein [Patescibacteria group bacterium]